MVVFAKKRISMEAVVLMATHCISHWEVEGGGDRQNVGLYGTK